MHDILERQEFSDEAQQVMAKTVMEKTAKTSEYLRQRVELGDISVAEIFEFAEQALTV